MIVSLAASSLLLLGGSGVGGVAPADSLSWIDCGGGLGNCCCSFSIGTGVWNVGTPVVERESVLGRRDKWAIPSFTLDSGFTKSVALGEKGTRQVRREHVVAVEDEQGKVVLDRQVEVVEVTSKAHRICYSRHFFPEKVADLRKRLFAGVENETMEVANVSADSPIASRMPPLQPSACKNPTHIPVLLNSSLIYCQSNLVDIWGIA